MYGLSVLLQYLWRVISAPFRYKPQPGDVGYGYNADEESLNSVVPTSYSPRPVKLFLIHYPSYAKPELIAALRTVLEVHVIEANNFHFPLVSSQPSADFAEVQRRYTPRRLPQLVIPEIQGRVIARCLSEVAMGFFDGKQQASGLAAALADCGGYEKEYFTDAKGFGLLAVEVNVMGFQVENAWIMSDFTFTQSEIAGDWANEMLYMDLVGTVTHTDDRTLKLGQAVWDRFHTGVWGPQGYSEQIAAVSEQFHRT